MYHILSVKLQDEDLQIKKEKRQKTIYIYMYIKYSVSCFRNLQNTLQIYRFTTFGSGETFQDWASVSILIYEILKIKKQNIGFKQFKYLIHIGRNRVYTNYVE